MSKHAMSSAMRDSEIRHIWGWSVNMVNIVHRRSEIDSVLVVCDTCRRSKGVDGTTVSACLWLKIASHNRSEFDSILKWKTVIVRVLRVGLE